MELHVQAATRNTLVFRWQLSIVGDVTSQAVPPPHLSSLRLRYQATGSSVVQYSSPLDITPLSRDHEQHVVIGQLHENTQYDVCLTSSPSLWSGDLGSGSGSDEVITCTQVSTTTDPLAVVLGSTLGSLAMLAMVALFVFIARWQHGRRVRKRNAVHQVTALLVARQPPPPYSSIVNCTTTTSGSNSRDGSPLHHSHPREYQGQGHEGHHRLHYDVCADDDEMSSGNLSLVLNNNSSRTADTRAAVDLDLHTTNVEGESRPVSTGPAEEVTILQLEPSADVVHGGDVIYCSTFNTVGQDQCRNDRTNDLDVYSEVSRKITHCNGRLTFVQRLRRILRS
jgi:hypothetical protein